MAEKDKQEKEKPEDEKEKSAKLEQNQHEEPMSFNGKVAVIGFFGGVFWSAIGYLAHFFNFTKISPNLVLSPWTVGEWEKGALGNVIGILLIGLLSILVAFLYSTLFKKINKMWPGFLLGILLWLIVFYIFNPIFPGLQSVSDLDRNTVMTTICLYLLYGVFVGYSISFDANELNQPKEKALANE